VNALSVSWWELIQAVLIGLVLGSCYFGALFWTVRRLPTSRHPGLLAFASFVLRNVFIIAGLLWLIERHWLALLVSLIGFVSARQIAVMVWGPPRRKGRKEQVTHGND
jgi:F1F0 ATPase subunit 2